MSERHINYVGSGARWVGNGESLNCMTRLKHVSTVQTGVTLSGEGDPADPEWPYLRVANVQVGNVDLREIKTVRVPSNRAAMSMLQSGDVLMTEGGDIDKLGRGALWRGEVPNMLHQNHIFAVRPSEALDSEFLVYWLDGPVARTYFRVTAKQTTNLAGTNKWTLGNMPVPVPPLGEQRAIADYLDRETARIDMLIEEQQCLIELLRERRDGVVTKMFLDSTSEERAIKYAVDDVTVGIVVEPSRWYVDAGVPALRGVNVKRGSISLTDLVNISEDGHAAHMKSHLCSGDVVVVRTGQAGAAAKIPDELHGANAIDILIIKPGEGIDPDFLVWYLNSPLAASRIEHGSVGALQGHFNVSALRGLPLPRVSLAEQQRIVAFLEEEVAKIDSTIVETEQFIELARERRAALITAAVTGQIDVREMA
jgi:restriction endonuclease S subunit